MRSFWLGWANVRLFCQRKNKSTPCFICKAGRASAEREGFEPPVPLGTTVFKTVVIDHSTTFPIKKEGLENPLSLLAVWTGLEPATPCVTGTYSNQLNYHTVSWLNGLFQMRCKGKHFFYIGKGRLKVFAKLFSTRCWHLSLQVYKKRKVVITTTQSLINLKSNTMKNTMQKYRMFSTCASNPRKNCRV